MDKKWLILGLACAAAVVGVVYALGFFSSGPVEPVGPNSTGNYSAYREIPLGQSFSINTGIILDKAVAPAYFELGYLIPGATIDVWTGSGEVVIGEAHIGYLPGDPLWVLIYNGLDSPATFGLEFVNAPLDVNHSDITGGDYLKAPAGALEGMVVGSVVTVGSKSAVKVPISLALPEVLDYPDSWEFRLLVTNLEVTGSMTAGHELRFFCTME